MVAQETDAARSPTSPFSQALTDIPPNLRDALQESLARGPRLAPADAREVVARWREAAGDSAAGLGWLLMAHLWRQAGLSDSAYGALKRAARAGGTPPGLLSLEMARTAFFTGRPDIGFEAYWEGCARAERPVLAEYWQDFAAIATPEEEAEWDKLVGDDSSAGPPADACAFLRRAWSKRASRAGMSAVGRLAVHYERLRYARERFPLIGEGLRLGPQTRLLSVQAGRPTAVALDDRGLVYVRLGEPDRKTGFLGGGSSLRKIPPPNSDTPRDKRLWIEAARALQVSDECYQPNESWAYDYPDGTRVYHFSPLEGAANWWLLENLHDVYRCGDPTAAVTISGGQVWTATLSPALGQRHAPVGQVAWLVLGDLYMSRSGLDPAFAALANRIYTSGPDDPNDMEGLLNFGPGVLEVQAEFVEEWQTNVSLAEEILTAVSERPAIRAEVPLVYEWLQFRMAGGRAGEGVTRVWLNAVTEGKRLRGEPMEGGGFRYKVRTTLSLVDALGGLHQREALFSLTAPDELGAGAGVPVRLAADLPPGTYDYTLVVRDANDGRDSPAGNWRRDSLLVRRFGASLPQLSDVAFAPDSGGSWSPEPEVMLEVSPVHRTNRERRAWLYFEAYGLSPAGDYVTEVQMEPQAGGAPFTLTYPGTVPASERVAVRQLLRLELGDTEPGEYAVRITVTDAIGRRSLPLLTHLLVQP